MKDYHWIDRQEYPFQSNYIKLDMGKMHYIDEGQGSPIVMFHGNPTWSFLYRKMVKGLSEKYRCIAMDYLGFGLSDKSPNGSYLPKEHARNAETLIEALELNDITLVVQDWGGPIGLSYAINNSANVSKIILMNTWMWPSHHEARVALFSGFLGGPIGRFMITQFNFFARVIMKIATAEKGRLPKSTHKHYLKPLKRPYDRKASWVFPQQLIKSTDWLKHLWSQRKKIESIPTLIVWGMKDLAFQKKDLEIWKTVFKNFELVKAHNVGHYVQEEAGFELNPIIDQFIECHSKLT